MPSAPGPHLKFLTFELQTENRELKHEDLNTSTFEVNWVLNDMLFLYSFVFIVAMRHSHPSHTNVNVNALFYASYFHIALCTVFWIFRQLTCSLNFFMDTGLSYENFLSHDNWPIVSYARLEQTREQNIRPTYL